MADKKVKKIVVDRNLCIGAGPCVFAAGTVFELDAENKAVLKQKGKKDSGPTDRAELEDGAVSDDDIITAAQSCPVKAIIVTAEDDSQICP